VYIDQIIPTIGKNPIRVFIKYGKVRFNNVKLTLETVKTLVNYLRS